MGMHQAQRMDLRQELRQALIQQQVLMMPGEGVEHFRTDEEKSQVSQYEVLKQLSKIIEQDGFIDKDHFGLELNRTIFGHSLETRLGDFGRDIEGVIGRYGASEEFSKEVIFLLGTQKEEATRKNIPGQIASAWNRVSSSPYLPNEDTTRNIPRLIKLLAESDADIASGLDIVSQAAGMSDQRDLVETSLNKVREYADSDARIIPFAHSVLSPVFRAVNERKDSLTKEEARAVYSQVVESLYMLDRELRVTGSVQRIRDAIKQHGLRGLLSRSNLPIPIQTSLDNITDDDNIKNRVSLLCNDSDFEQGREIKRRVYRGISSIEDLTDGSQILDHVSKNVGGSKQLSRVLGALSLVSHDPDFVYSFELTGEEPILRNLRLQLTDKSVRRLGFDDATLKRYIKRLESDDRFEGIGKIATTLAGYSHYRNDEQTNLLREIMQAELDGKFNEWRYSHDKAREQLKILDDRVDSWKKNSKVTRLVGELDALRAHTESARWTAAKLSETYREYYGEDLDEQTVKKIEEKISENEDKLRSEDTPKSRKEIGYQTSLLREQLSYAELIGGLRGLTFDNYQEVLATAERISKKKSKNPLYHSASWIRDVLDQPVYRDARRISVIETDDLENLLRMGETPIPHCQDWRSDSTLNGSLLSFVADSNKKLYHIANGNDKPVGMSLVRLVDWDNTPTLLVENIYANEWSDDYGIALLGSLADKAAAINKETGKEVRIAVPYHSGHDAHDTNIQVKNALERFSAQYKVYIHEGKIDVIPAPSKNKFEYWDCGPGKVASGSSVSINVKYLRFGEE